MWFSHMLSQAWIIYRRLKSERGQDCKGHFTDGLINAFNKYLPITYYKPGTVVGIGERAARRALLSWSFHSCGEADSKHVIT